MSVCFVSTFQYFLDLFKLYYTLNLRFLYNTILLCAFQGDLMHVYSSLIIIDTVKECY